MESRNVTVPTTAVARLLHSEYSGRLFGYTGPYEALPADGQKDYERLARCIIGVVKDLDVDQRPQHEADPIEDLCMHVRVTLADMRGGHWSDLPCQCVELRRAAVTA